MPSITGHARAQEPVIEATPAAPAGDAEAPYLGLVADDRLDPGKGIRIVEILSDGPADAAGLKAGDLIVGVNDQPAQTMADLAKSMEGARPGDMLKLEVEREGQRSQHTVTLDRRPPPNQRPFREFGEIPEPAAPLVPPPLMPARRRLLGLRAAPLDDDTRQFLRVPGDDGVLVTEVEPDSPAFAAGMKRDAVIVEVNGHPVTSPADLIELVQRAGPGQAIELTYFLNGQLQKQELKLRELAEVGPESAFTPAPLTPDELTPAPGPEAGLIGRLQWLEQRVRALEARLAELTEALEQRPAAPQP